MTVASVALVTVDLRSDTLIRPTDAMRQTMADAEVGDDVYDEVPTVIALQERRDALLGKEDALFTPTGSVASVLAVVSLVARSGGALRGVGARRPRRARRPHRPDRERC